MGRGSVLWTTFWTSRSHARMVRVARPYSDGAREGPHRKMDTTTDTNGAYTSGDWHVRAGSEDAFIARWHEFLEYARTSAPGFVSARLYRDSNDARHFVSLGEWQSVAAQATWRGLPDFADKFAACHALCEEDRNSNYTLTDRVL